MELTHGRAAAEWNEALPIGDGKLGAMVFGGVERERLSLNADSRWSGFPRDRSNPRAPGVLAEVRRLLAGGDYAAADAACHVLMGPCTETCLPLGDLLIDIDTCRIRSYRAPVTAAGANRSGAAFISSMIARFCVHFDSQVPHRVQAVGFTSFVASR